MAAEYSYIPLQTVAEDENILFMEGDRSCRKGLIRHRNGSGVFKLKGASDTCKTIYRVQFNANIAVATVGGVVGPISVSLQEDGETIATATVTPTVAGAFFNVSLSTFVTIQGGCCATISVENTSGTAIDVNNANIIFDRVA